MVGSKTRPRELSKSDNSTLEHEIRINIEREIKLGVHNLRYRSLSLIIS